MFSLSRKEKEGMESESGVSTRLASMEWLEIKGTGAGEGGTESFGKSESPEMRKRYSKGGGVET